MQNTQFYQDAFITYLKTFTTTKEPISLYNPINYILQLGGKRLRPVLTLMTAEIFDCEHKKALNAALAIEVFQIFR
jgi:geranylgeranyl diphosphate synthase type II